MIFEPSFTDDEFALTVYVGVTIPLDVSKIVTYAAEPADMDLAEAV